MDEAVQQFRRRAARELGDRQGAERRYSVGLREQAVAYWRVRERAGDGFQAVAMAVGVTPGVCAAGRTTAVCGRFRWWRIRPRVQTLTLELTSHVLKRMEDRGFNEVDLRHMLKHASDHSPDTMAGRFVIEARRGGQPWAVIVEPDERRQLLVVVTAYPMEEAQSLKERYLEITLRHGRQPTARAIICALRLMPDVRAA